MDINNIKPPAGLGPRFDLPDDKARKAGREATFADAAAKLRGTGATPPLQALSKLSKAALDVPEQLDAILRQCVSELIENGEQTTGPLSKADKQSLTDFLSQDPHVRRQLESYLRKVAT
jgi:hypothetical protein